MDVMMMMMMNETAVNDTNDAKTTLNVKIFRFKLSDDCEEWTFLDWN